MGEGARGEAHELKQGAHDEEEEPTYCNTHTHKHMRTCTGKGTQAQGGRMCLRVFQGMGVGVGVDVGPVTSKVLGHSPPPPVPSLSPSSAPPPSAGMWLTLMMSLHFSALPVSAPLRGQGSRRDPTGSIHLPFTITTLGSAVQLNWLPQRRSARRGLIMQSNSLEAKLLPTTNNEGAISLE